MLSISFVVILLDYGNIKYPKIFEIFGAVAVAYSQDILHKLFIIILRHQLIEFHREIIHQNPNQIDLWGLQRCESKTRKIGKVRAGKLQTNRGQRMKKIDSRFVTFI